MVKDSISNRIRVTRTGKLIRRKMGLDHFRAKKSGRELGRKSNPVEISSADRGGLLKKYGLLRS